jgi:hypothetical protein
VISSLKKNLFNDLNMRYVNKIFKYKHYHTFKKIKIDFVKDFCLKYSRNIPREAFTNNGRVGPYSVDTPYHKIDPH